ncbi:MAG TPA: hypothetical protein VGM73_14405 [Candidatus Didemnitutus sp.]|jgi:hypothetical protein
MTSAQLIPAIIVPIIAWRIYLRLRRNIGRQHFRPQRLAMSITFFSIVSVVIGSSVWSFPNALLALGGGMVAGAALSFVGLRLTRFEQASDGLYYVPNTALGVALTVLLIGRIAYRVVILFYVTPPPGQYVPPVLQSPLTLGVYGLTVGYYIAYQSAVLVRGKALAAAPSPPRL